MRKRLHYPPEGTKFQEIHFAWLPTRVFDENGANYSIWLERYITEYTYRKPGGYYGTGVKRLLVQPKIKPDSDKS